MYVFFFLRVELLSFFTDSLRECGVKVEHSGKNIDTAICWCFMILRLMFPCVCFMYCILYFIVFALVVSEIDFKNSSRVNIVETVYVISTLRIQNRTFVDKKECTHGNFKKQGHCHISCVHYSLFSHLFFLALEIKYLLSVQSRKAVFFFLLNSGLIDFGNASTFAFQLPT